MKTFLFLIIASVSISSCSVLQQTSTTTTDTVSNYTGRVGCASPMKAAEFAEFKKTLSAYTFEVRREEMCKQMIAEKCFTVAQTRSIISLFDFEHNRLKMLKVFFHNNYDVDNYTQLLDMLDFDSNKSELQKYIMGQP